MQYVSKLIIAYLPQVFLIWLSQLLDATCDAPLDSILFDKFYW